MVARSAEKLATKGKTPGHNEEKHDTYILHKISSKTIASRTQYEESRNWILEGKRLSVKPWHSLQRTQTLARDLSYLILRNRILLIEYPCTAKTREGQNKTFCKLG